MMSTMFCALKANKQTKRLEIYSASNIAVAAVKCKASKAEEAHHLMSLVIFVCLCESITASIRHNSVVTGRLVTKTQRSPDINVIIAFKIRDGFVFHDSCPRVWSARSIIIAVVLVITKKQK